MSTTAKVLARLDAAKSKQEKKLLEFKQRSSAVENKASRLTLLAKERKVKSTNDKQKMDWMKQQKRLKDQAGEIEEELFVFISESGEILSSDDISEFIDSRAKCNQCSRDLLLKIQAGEQYRTAITSLQQEYSQLEEEEKKLRHEINRLYSFVHNEVEDTVDDIASRPGTPQHQQQQQALNEISSGELSAQVPAVENEDKELRAVFELQFAKLHAEYSDKISAAEEKLKSLKSQIKLTNEQHQIYLKVLKELRADGQVSLKDLTIKCLDNMKAIEAFREAFLPYAGSHRLAESEKQILAHHQIILGIEIEQRKLRDFRVEYNNKQSMLMSKMKEALELSAQLLEMKLRHQKEQEEFEQRNQQLHDQLQQQQQKKLQELEVEYQKKQEELRRQQELEQAMQEKKMRERQEQKQKLQQYMSEQEEFQKNIAAARAQEAVARQKEHELEARKNQKRLVARNQIEKEKLAEKERREAEKMLAKQQQQQKLEKLREQVISNLSPAALERNFERAVKGTVQSKNKNIQIPDEAAEEMKAHNPFKPVHGYQTNDVMKDVRMKLQIALTAAGLMDTEYGRKMLLEAKPARAPRPDMLGNLNK